MQSFKNLTSTVPKIKPVFGYGWLPRFVAGRSLFCFSIRRTTMEPPLSF